MASYHFVHRHGTVGNSYEAHNHTEDIIPALNQQAELGTWQYTHT